MWRKGGVRCLLDDGDCSFASYDGKYASESLSMWNLYASERPCITRAIPSGFPASLHERFLDECLCRTHLLKISHRATRVPASSSLARRSCTSPLARRRCCCGATRCSELSPRGKWFAWFERTLVVRRTLRINEKQKGVVSQRRWMERLSRTGTEASG